MNSAPDFVREAQRGVTRHKLKIILFARRAWWKHTGNREAARKVTRELFDLAFKPGELVG